MPQITVNEIDQSVVTRVVTDDKVKVLCPIIASFGPGYDETQDSIKTFTDVTDFNRSFGYTYAEFNPFTDDRSRMYARELIKKGAAVSVVRVNNSGYTSTIDINGSGDRSTGTMNISNVCPAALNNQELVNTIEDDKITSGTTTHINTVPGSVFLTLTIGGTNVTLNDYKKDGKFYKANTNGEIVSVATINYVNGQITTTETLVSATFQYFYGVQSWEKYVFCPQIESITAKYHGSFGNNIAISIAQINTSRLAESYQYASISVYYIDRDINYTYDATTGISTISSQTVKSVTLLENHRVSTNPDSPDYFEDVEFDFIRINATPSARSELSLIWSNINANPTSSAQYSGFPVIPLKYIPHETLVQRYNFDSILTGGSDFMYSPATLEKLKSGFKGYWASSTAWTVNDVNTYTDEVYGTETSSGIIPTIFTTLSELYGNFTDPYMYDFDFITSSGFIYEEYKVGYVTVSNEPMTLSSGVATIGKAIEAGSVEINGTVEADGESTAVTYTDDGDGKLVQKGTTKQVGTIVYTNGLITLTSVTGLKNEITVTYGDQSVPKIATPTVPMTSNTTNSAGNQGYYAFYTEVTPIHQSMLNLVTARQDCIALFDLPRDYDPTLAIDYARILNTSYGTVHHPWCWVNSPDISGKQIIMPPSYIFLYTFLSNLINNVESQKWFPPAGVERATARVVVRPDYEIGSTILNDWQNDNISRVNPIMRLKQYGYVIYGQYTTLPAIDMYTHSALESLNVRLISNVVKKKIFDTCMNLAFEPNTANLWLKFFAQLDPFLRYMKYNDGLYDYRIVMDSSTVTTDDINHLRCPGKVYIAPTRTAEFFDIDFIITGAGAEFNE